LKHYGEILHAKFLSDYPAIVDKVKVTMITDGPEVEKRLAIARKVYDERNRRLESMTDESVDTFYSCLLCQSFAPNHVCIITPERLGLCGAYNWLDGKAAYEIDETGPNQPVKKGDCLDPVKGIWKGIDDYVYINSHKSVNSFTAYSIMYLPMTSCGCFEVICAYVPECNGVMAVNREFQGDTPVGMTFSTLAGEVGGGQQTPGFMGCGKVFLSSKKFLYAEGGHKRLVWMPKDLKELLADDLKKRFEEQEVPDLLEKIADETTATDAHAVREFMEKNKHPALEMEDLASYSQAAPQIEAADPIGADEEESPETPGLTGHDNPAPPGTKAAPQQEMLTEEILNRIKEQVTKEVSNQLKTEITRQVVNEIIHTLSSKFLGKELAALEREPGTTSIDSTTEETKPGPKIIDPKGPRAEERLSGVTAFKIKKEACEVPVWAVKLGAGKEEGGTRGKTYTIGGETCMPFHFWEGDMPNRPLVAMEVFDTISEKYPPVLKDIYGDLLESPARMAQVCVEKYGADLISVRLEGTHPEKGNRSPAQAAQLVKDVLAAVDVPLIVTGHSHFDSNNEVLKAVAQACAGENLLLNWVEQDNYRTIAGAAMAYHHCIVAQSPIDVNIAKQMNILLTNMDIKIGKIVMDPLTSAAGYGIEYTYSVMERIRQTALNGDKMLAGPMIVSPGQECSKVKEYKAAETDFPAWGALAKRAAMWELSTAVSLLYAGADLFIMYHPEAAKKLKETIFKLL
jgi:CO dehydrogenase/acetyl-CoA synthase delta subunit